MTKAIKLTKFMPWLDETPITEQTFIDFGFKRNDVSMEESGEDEPSHYYTFEFGDTYDPTLMSNNDFTGVNIFNLTEDYKTWKTNGEMKMLFKMFLNDEGENNK